MKKQVYIVSQHYIEEDTELMLENKVFTDNNEAFEYFSQIVEDERIKADDNGWEIEVDKPDEFLAYEDGYYCQNHTFVKLETHEIEF